jgi:hypothetical protein
MTPAEAYEHVRLRRPRVLLASAQWQVSHHQNYMFLYAIISLPPSPPPPPTHTQRKGEPTRCHVPVMLIVN